MSDAIVLDVADATPVRLDVGDADPIARQEIAELAGRVTTVEGDVTALDSRMDTAEGDISTLGTTVDGIDARVEAIEADGSVTPVKLADTPFPSLLAGAALSLTGDEPTEATFLDRACPGTTGQATVQSVRGNTVVQDGSLLPVRMEGIETTGDGWTSQLAIPASTYFPDGMRSAGTVYDELTETQAITRVGSVDLGTLTWTITEFPTSSGIYRLSSDQITDVASGVVTNIKCALFSTDPEPLGSNSHNKAIVIYNRKVYLRDDAYTDAASFKAAMSVVMLHYELATPTTTTFDTPLNLTYRAEHGGTERITHTEQSAPPVLSIAYGHTAEGIVREAASAIAAQDGPTATANHAVGSYLTMGGTLYRVTRAIATGEAITPGTNVMATTVMAEVLSLIQ
jgi:hypothetical protein